MLKRLYGHFQQYRKDLIGSAVCVVFECSFELLIPLLMANIIDIGVMQRNRAYILRQSLWMVCCALAALLLGALYARLAARASAGFGAQLRKAEYQKVQAFSFSNLDHFRTASLVTRLTNDVTILQNTISNGIRPMVRGPVMMLLALVMSILLSPRLAVVFLIAIPVLGVGLFFIIRRLSPIYGRMQKALDRVNAIIQENLIAVRTVKAYVTGDRESLKFSKVNTEYRSASEQAFHNAVLNMPYFQAVMYATILCLLWFGGNLIHVGQMQVGELTGFLSYVLQILNSLMMISGVFIMLSRSATSASRIFEVLDETPDIPDEGNPQLQIQKGEIVFSHVFFKYQPQAPEYVLADIDLQILPGQTVGIFGGTGSAKSSLVQLIPRLYEVTKGELRIDGHDVREYTLENLRAAVGMVLQKNTLFSGTIRENLLWGNANATQQQLDKACWIACADEFLSRMPQGYETDLGQGGVNLSGGQKQRLCIARALLKEPRILIFDDSTSAVDTATEQQIRERLAAAMPHTTVLMITQRVRALEHADQIVILQDGRINAVGTHTQLLQSNPIYQDIYQFQKEGAAV